MKRWWKRNSIQKSKNVDNATVLPVERGIARPLGKVSASCFFFLTLSCFIPYVPRAGGRFSGFVLLSTRRFQI